MNSSSYINECGHIPFKHNAQCGIAHPIDVSTLST